MRPFTEENQSTIEMTKTKTGFLVFLLIILAGVKTSSAQEIADNERILKTFHSISSNELLDFATELSSEKYQGRLSGSPGYQLAAQWCADKFRECGVKPANNGSYFQYFPNEYSDVLSLGVVIYTSDGEQTSLNFLEDYLPGSNSSSGTVEAELVYVGYGISAPELDYDDYKNVDVTGKIVVMEPGIPYTKNDPEMASWTPYAYHRDKFRNALRTLSKHKKNVRGSLDRHW